MHSFAPPSDASTFVADGGRAIVWFPVPGVAAARLVGYATGELARQAYALTDAQPAPPHLGFIDLRETTGFDWEARGRALKWNLLHLSARLMLHMLVREPPMIVATKVFRHALKNHVEIHTTQETFASAYQITVRKRARVVGSQPPPRL